MVQRLLFGVGVNIGFTVLVRIWANSARFLMNIHSDATWSDCKWTRLYSLELIIDDSFDVKNVDHCVFSFSTLEMALA